MTRIAIILLASAGILRAEWAELGSDELERYFERRVTKLEGTLAEIGSLEGWNERRAEYQRQLRDMMGLDPLPERTPLKAVVTGKVERDEFTVENLHFQSSPGLYVTGNLYLPAKREGAVPAVLYVCGHGPTKVDGVSYGNKVTYQHHGIWFARNGYACLVIDSLQLGEIEAIHHGLYRYDRWWWISRGYTPAGVEAWNCIRALDYLQSRPEVDGERIGVTGRSGGGAYSWWVAALDERITAAVPVAGIASLRNHVVDGCVEGHCDCMYQLNTYGWDFEAVAALVAPRALLISNTDKDDIFPLDGVYHVHQGTRRIYDLHGAGDKLGLNIEEGPHQDTQPLRVSAFHWMNRFLKGAERTDTFEMAAAKMLEPQDLKVFDALPGDEINTTIDEVFGPSAPEPSVPQSVEEWEAMKKGWMAALREKCFHHCPQAPPAPRGVKIEDDDQDGTRWRVYDLKTEDDVTCWVAVAHQADQEAQDIRKVTMTVFDEEGWEAWDRSRERPERGEVLAYFCPRGIGAKAWTDDSRKLTQIRRRFPLVGQSLDAMRAFDIVQAIRILRSELPEEAAITIAAERAMAGNALYASLFLDKPLHSLVLRDLPASHHDGPFYLNVLRHLDLPQAVAMAGERAGIAIHGKAEDWAFPLAVAEKLGWPQGQIAIVTAAQKDR